MDNLLHINDTPDLAQLKRKVATYNPDANWELIEKAFFLAERVHAPQKRADGSPYFYHPFNVAMIVGELRMDSTCISAALLHDVVEDTEITVDYIRDNFSPVMARLVDGVTKISKLAFKTKVEHQAENIRKMLLAMSEDIRVIIIKLADRLNNVLTLSALPPEKQKRIARETLDIYSPLSHRLGMHQIKSLLEDYCFNAIEPAEYEKIHRQMAERANERDNYVEQTIELLTERFKENHIQATIYGRTKHLYSIWRKMLQNNKTIDEIYDLLAVRIILPTVRDCYTALGIVHDLWTPMPGRFKDYIAIPKQNLYQSLHTTVMQKVANTNEGLPLEIQIRTEEMDRVAEAGIAAHWDYKEVKNQSDNLKVNQKISWLRQLIDWHSEIQDATDFMHNLKNDLFQDEVFVFTPTGDVVALPASGTPLDFAFTVHTDVGIRCSGAKVNGKIVPLDYQLKNGDVVEVITSNQSHPNTSWLEIVKSHRAKNKIRQYLRKQEHDVYLDRGKITLQKGLKRMQKIVEKAENPPFNPAELSPGAFLKTERIKKMFSDSDFRNPEEIMVALGGDKLSFQHLFNKVYPEWNLYLDTQKRLKKIGTGQEKKSKSTQGIIVEGIDNPLLNFSRCCNPLPGDRIVGYITRGRGISVHRSNCPNIKSMNERERLIALHWDQAQIKKGTFFVSIRLEVDDRPNMILDITQVLSTQMSLNISNLNARSNKNGGGIINVQIELSEVAQLEGILARLAAIPEVLKAYRLK